MGRRGGRDRALDVATALLLLGAVLHFARTELVPAWRARGVLEVGDRVPELTLRALAGGDTLRLSRGSPTLLLIFRSSCPSCGRNAPAWRRLLAGARPQARAFAVGLEPDGSALDYVRERFPAALAVRPLQEAEFLRRFAVTAVPTTLYVDAGGRLRAHLRGVLPPERVASLTARIRREAGVPSRGTSGHSGASGAPRGALAPTRSTPITQRR